MVGDVIANQLGAAITEKVISSKDNVFTRLYSAVKLAMADPEKIDAHVFVQNGEVVAEITPNKDDLKTKKKARQIVLKIKTREIVHE